MPKDPTHLISLHVAADAVVHAARTVSNKLVTAVVSPVQSAVSAMLSKQKTVSALLSALLLWASALCESTQETSTPQSVTEEGSQNNDQQRDFLRVVYNSPNDVKALGISGKSTESNAGASALFVERGQLDQLREELRQVQLRLDMAAMRGDVHALRKRIDALLSSVQPPASGGGPSDKRPTVSESGAASTYVRWGHCGCPGSAEVVYSGVMAGSHYSTSGGAANDLCLPLTPTFTTQIAEPAFGVARLYGVEYESHPNPSNDVDGLCAVCRVARATSVTIPATETCPTGWSREYSGYLMAGKPDSGRVSTEYICVDGALQGREGSEANSDEGVLYFTKYSCSSLPCPPFRDRAIVTCVVCSK